MAYEDFIVEFANAELSSIDFGNRAREDYGEVEKLASTFDSVGLIQPLAVKHHSNPESGFKYLLLAGGRRYIALVFHKAKNVPVRIYADDITDEMIKTIELLENVTRKDFTWEETARLEKEIHDMQVGIHGEKISTAKDALGWSQADTAKLLGKSASAVSDSLKMASMLNEVPELAACKTAADARKILKQISKQKKQKVKAAKAQEDILGKTDSQMHQKLIDSFIIGDCLEGMKGLEKWSFDFAEIDPPYGIDYTTFAKGTSLGYEEIEADFYKDFMRNTLTEVYRVLKPNAWIVLWYAINPWHNTMLELLEEVGFQPQKIPGMWYKPEGQLNCMSPNTSLARGYEPFIYARKGKPDIVTQGRSDVFSVKQVPVNLKYHPTERPVKLIEQILTAFAEPHSHVLVPFMGSGKTLLAAANCEMTGVGFDLTETYKEGYIVKVTSQHYGQYTDEGEKK
jgi:ParB/RepB/Spo0J family partition protein